MLYTLLCTALLYLNGQRSVLSQSRHQQSAVILQCLQSVAVKLHITWYGELQYSR